MSLDSVMFIKMSELTAETDALSLSSTLSDWSNESLDGMMNGATISMPSRQAHTCLASLTVSSAEGSKRLVNKDSQCQSESVHNSAVTERDEDTEWGYFVDTTI